MKTTVGERLRIYLKQNKITLTAFSKTMGTSYPALSEMTSGKRPVSEGMFARICDQLPDLNPDWLKTGVGPMKKETEEFFQTRPHIEGAVAAGYAELGFPDPSFPEQHEMIPDVGDYDFTINVKGESMLPTIADGDTIACRHISSVLEIHDGRIYAVSTRDGAAVKRLYIRKHHIEAVSDNPEYKPFNIYPDSATRIAEVVALIRKF